MSRFDPALLERALRAVGSARPPAADPDAGPGDAGRAIEVAAELARRFEGLILCPYLCPAGYWTIGYGARQYADGRPVRSTDRPITRAQAERLLHLQVRDVYLPAVLRLCPGLARESPERLAALVDFAFNLGAGRLQASTLRRRINAGEWDHVPAELRRWVYGAGRALPGLVARREAEAALI